MPAYAALSCISAPGTGRNHSWMITVSVCAQPTVGGPLLACRNQTSDVFPVGTSYGAPAVASVESDGVFSGTPGGEEVLIKGANFGFDIAKVRGL